MFDLQLHAISKMAADLNDSVATEEAYSCSTENFFSSEESRYPDTIPPIK